MAKQKLDYSTLETLILDELGTMSENFTPTYEQFTTLLDKIGATISLQSGIKDHLEMFDDITLPMGTTVEEYIHDLLTVKAYDPNSTPYGQDTIDTKKAYHTRSGDKKIELPVWESEMERAFTSKEAYASFLARMLQRIEDTKNEYKYQAKKYALGEKIIRDAHCQVYDADTQTWVNELQLTYCGNADVDTNILNISKNKVVASNGKRVENDVMESKVRNIQVAIPTNKATADSLILTIQQIIEDMKFTARKYNPFGVLQQGSKENLVLLIKKGTMPILNVVSLASAFNKELLGLGVEIVIVDDFGFTDTDTLEDYLADKYTWLTDTDKENNALQFVNKLYGVLCDKNIIKYCETRNTTKVDINGNALRSLYTHHFGENVITSDAVNYVLLLGSEI